MTPPDGLASCPTRSRSSIKRRRGSCETSSAARSGGTTNRPSARGGIHRRNPPSAARARHIADRVHDLAQINSDRTPLLRAAGEQRLNALPFFVRQIARIALRFLRDVGHVLVRRSGPHPKLETLCPLGARSAACKNEG